ncbi:MAG: hypothetical protein ABF633_06765 [Clostridium sp.]|uniref:hypothetical protein n=1 Tax=Clostridium sp. TaxID=1506 RepID=UPI0039ED3CB7
MLKNVLVVILSNDFYKLFISGFFLPIIISFITFKITNIMNNRRNSIQSKNIIFHEINRINKVSEDFHTQAAQNINYLKENCIDGVVSIVLTGMYTIYSDKEWIAYINILKAKLSATEYDKLISFHKIYTNLDSIYPIKSYKDKVEDNKDELLKWWSATENIYINEQIKEMKNEIEKIEKKLKRLK